MVTTTNKQKLLNHILSAFPAEPGDGEEIRPIFEQFIYGLCRENATPAQADSAYRALCERFYDWNEVRVSSQREIEEIFEGMPQAELRSQRLLAFLHEIFDTTFVFNMDDLQKKKGGVKDAIKQIMRYQAANDFVTSWVVQRTLGGHAVPLDGQALRCVRRLGLVDATQEDTEAARATLEHLVPKAKGLQFFDSLTLLAEEYCWQEDPNCPQCPLHSECAYAQERGVTGATTNGRSHRPKPR